MKRNDAACCANCSYFIYDWCVKHQEDGQIEFPLNYACDDHEEKKHAETK